MKKLIKRLSTAFTLFLILVVLLPLLLLQFGSDNIKTSIKIILSSLVGYGVASPDEQVVSQRLITPVGFTINQYATELGKVRFMALADNGDLLVSRPRENDIVLLKNDLDGDGLADAQLTLLSGLTKPHGIAIDDNWLYVAESNGVGRVAFDSATATIKGGYQRIVNDLDDSGNHWTKTINIGDDGWVYLSQGSSCNVCEESDPLRATIMRFKKDGSEQTVFATGLRNSVGFDWAPWSGDLYATDNGRDLLGDDYPPCEFNKIVEGGFYGWPYINGDGDLDPDLGAGKESLLATSISPVHHFRAHNAPLGMRFLRHTSDPDYEKTALVALHGSWNRSKRDGYKVVSLHWQEDGSFIEQDFVSGFELNDDVIGRPVDIVEAKNGTIYISDDYAGVIYRVRPQDEMDDFASIAQPSDNLEQVPAAVVDRDPNEILSTYTPEQLATLKTTAETIYRQYQCAGCHDPRMARSNRNIIEIKNIHERYSLEELMDYFVTPTPPMPVYPLNEQQREALAVYFYGL
jgi:glucose/arabinose dehydrogenase/cytochrome c553